MSNITVWWHTHVLKKFICSQSQAGRQGAELQPVLVCSAGGKSVHFSMIHHPSLKLCSLPNTAIVLQAVWCCWPKTLSLFYHCIHSISRRKPQWKKWKQLFLSHIRGCLLSFGGFLWGCAQEHGGLLLLTDSSDVTLKAWPSVKCSGWWCAVESLAERELCVIELTHCASAVCLHNADSGLKQQYIQSVQCEQPGHNHGPTRYCLTLIRHHNYSWTLVSYSYHEMTVHYTH